LEITHVLTQDEWDYVIERLTVFVSRYEKPREALVSPFGGTELAANLISGTPAEIVRDIGKDTAYVNVGTHLTSILDDLRARYPALGAEL
jgi:hypothetical protein